MFVNLGQLQAAAPVVAATSPPKPLASGIKGLDAIDLAIISAITITEPLASSPSQNEAMRRNLVTTLGQASSAAERYSSSLSSGLGWPAESKAFMSVKDDADGLAVLAKSASWGVLDTGVRALRSRFDAARNAVFSRALSEAEAAKNSARAKILGFVASKPMSEDDWAAVAKIADDVQSDVDKINRLPLSPRDATLYLGAGRQLQAEIDMRLKDVSSFFMNSSEEITRGLGMTPQRGRWIAAWLERNKWPILGVGAASVAFEAWRRRKK